MTGYHNGSFSRSLSDQSFKYTKPRRISALASAAMVVLAHSSMAQTPIGSTLTYHGFLLESGDPVNDAVDLDFILFDAPGGGNKVADVISMADVKVIDGQYTVRLDFGLAVFNGDARWLQIEVDAVPQEPREELTATPYAMLALDADLLDGKDSQHFANAANLTTGTLSDLRLSSNVARLNAQNEFTAAVNVFHELLTVKEDLEVEGTLFVGPDLRLESTEPGFQVSIDTAPALKVEPRSHDEELLHEGFNFLAGHAEVVKCEARWHKQDGKRAWGLAPLRPVIDCDACRPLPLILRLEAGDPSFRRP